MKNSLSGRPEVGHSETHAEHLSVLAEACRPRSHGGEMWRPRMFRAALPDDAQELADLLRSCPEISVFDTLDEQVRELVETRNPGRTLDPRTLREQMTAMRGGASRQEYGVWVYYPWSKRLVHILDREEFIELRTNRNRYKITQAEQDLLCSKVVGIVGLSVGQSVALTMAMERSVGEIRLADFDTLGLSNLNRLRAGVHNIGVPKVYITAREISEIDPYITLKCYPDGLAYDTIDDFLLSGGSLDLLIDECDSLDIKIWMRHHARHHRIPVLMETSDRGLVDVERFDLEPDRPLFHGLVGDLQPEELGGLSTNDKIPYVLQIIGEPTISDRARASMMEVGHSIKTWPQLASAVTLGGGVAADVARRMNLNTIRHSGRYWVDVEQDVPNTPAEPTPEPQSTTPPVLTVPTMQAIVAASPPAPAHSLPLTQALREQLVSAGIAAPSGGNNQPWRWLADTTRLHLFHERARSAALPDFNGTSGLVALGAVLENVTLTAHAAGLELEVAMLPAGDNADLIASISLHEQPSQHTEDHWRDELAPLVLQRHTNRKLARDPLSPEQLADLSAAVRTIPGADLQILEGDAELAAIGGLVGACDRLRFLDPACNRQLISELRWTPEEAAAKRDGISLDSLELSRGDRAAVQMLRTWSSLRLIRAWGGGRGLTEGSLKAISHSAAVGLITMPQATAQAFLAGGRAMQRMWLVAHTHALALHPMTALPYLLARATIGGGEGLEPDTVAGLQQLQGPYRRLFPLASGHADIFLFRLARAEATQERALRRNLDDVLTVV